MWCGTRREEGAGVSDSLAGQAETLASLLSDAVPQQSPQDTLAAWVQTLTTERSATGDTGGRNLTEEGTRRLVRVAGALERLSSSEREALFLRDFLGKPITEIARALGRSEIRVAGLVVQARRRLTCFLSDSH
jgi:DNA-directed RNA polymerase specialized sigma24 family protein